MKSARELLYFMLFSIYLLSHSLLTVIIKAVSY